MKSITTTTALNDYVKILNKQREIKAAYESENGKWQHTKSKIELYLLGQTEKVKDIPEEIKESEPFFAWNISHKTDEDLLMAIKTIRDTILPALEAETSERVALVKENKAALESYALALLEERKSSNFSVTGIGRVEKRLDVKYNVADKKLFVAWAVKEGCESELTISLRPNSKFMTQVVEEKSELPPGISSFKEQRAVFVKA